jgi:transposase
VPRPPVLPPDEKARIVLSVLAGETTLTSAAQATGVTPQAVSSWRRQFVEAGARGLTQPPSQGGTARRERELLNEITRLRAALGEAHLALIVGRRKRKRP